MSDLSVTHGTLRFGKIKRIAPKGAEKTNWSFQRGIFSYLHDLASPKPVNPGILSILIGYGALLMSHSTYKLFPKTLCFAAQYMLDFQENPRNVLNRSTVRSVRLQNVRK